MSNAAVGTTGLVIVAEATWSVSVDGPPPAVAGFIVSTFSPLVAAAAERCLSQATSVPYRTAVVIVTVHGDAASARHVADAVDAGARIGPLLFFQSVPNAIAGHLAARHGLDGPVVCLSPAAGASAADPLADPLAAGLAEAQLLIADEELDAALLVIADQGPDLAHALLVRPGARP